jgi:phage-related tail protein
MATQSKSNSPAPPDPLANMQAKTLDAVEAYAQASQRVFGQMIDLSSVAARETMRVYAELQSAAIDAVRTTPGLMAMMANPLDMVQDPFRAYRESVTAMSASPQQLAKLFEGNAEIVNKGVQRLQTSAERSTREIGEAVTAYFDRLGEIYRPR